MPPRFIYALGLSGLSSKDLRVDSRALSGCRDLYRCLQVNMQLDYQVLAQVMRVDSELY